MVVPASAAAAYASGWMYSLDTAANADSDAALEAGFVALARSEGPLRALLAELCARFVEGEGFARLGFASLADWAGERVGRSGRSVYDHAHVGAALRELPALRAALGAGRLGFAKLRLVVRAAKPENELRWIAFARGRSVEALAREVRKIDAGSLEYAALARDERRSKRLEFACSAEVVGLFGHACRAARQVSGQVLRLSECAEVIAAEVVSALPLAREFEAAAAQTASPSVAGAPGEPPPVLAAEAEPGLTPWLDAPHGPEDPCAGNEVPEAPRELRELWGGLEDADVFELERRLRAAFAFEQRLAAQIGGRLEHVLRRGVHLAFGYRNREQYQRERLGWDPSACRSLLRIERAARISPLFAGAWRGGALTFLQAGALAPLVFAELPEQQVAAWLQRARGFALRRLRADVEAALELRERDHAGWLRTGGLPGEAYGPTELADVAGLELGEREISANYRAADRELRLDRPEQPGREIRANSSAGARVSPPEPGPHEPASARLACHEAAGPEAVDRETGAISSVAPKHHEPCRVAMIVDTEVAQLFRAVHCSVRRRLEREAGRAVTPGEALGWMSAHVLRAWGVLDAKGGLAKLRREHRIFARDGWRCAVPGCSKMRSLHAHHVIYRTQGGLDDAENLVTLCAYHHLRGVHAGTLRIRGRAPHALRFELGIRAGHKPLAVYASGDRKLRGEEGSAMA